MNVQSDVYAAKGLTTRPGSRGQCPVTVAGEEVKPGDSALLTQPGYADL